MQLYIRSSVASLAEIIPSILDKSIERIIVNGERVKVASLRLRTFAEKGTICSDCGLHASHFAVESSDQCNSFHLNLYGMKGDEEILFTHDHTLARGLGGRDHISNTTTMCYPCNQKKAVIERRIKNSMREMAHA